MIVLDANVWVGVFLSQDIHHETSRRWFRQEVQAEQIFIVPAIFLAEIAGSISRRTGLPRLGRRASQVIIRAKQFEVRVIDQGIAILAANFASELSLRGADAIYVALAKRLDVPLITWDKELTQRASSVIAVRSPQVSTS